MKIVSPGLVPPARHQGTVIIFTAGVIIIFCRKSNPLLFSLHTEEWHFEYFSIHACDSCLTTQIKDTETKDFVCDYQKLQKL